MNPILIKKASVQINYPESLLNARPSDIERFNLKLLYKGFVTFFEESMDNPKTVPFILNTYKEIRACFDRKNSIIRR